MPPHFPHSQRRAALPTRWRLVLCPVHPRLPSRPLVDSFLVRMPCAHLASCSSFRTFADGDQCASFDGDADRLMFFFTEGGGQFRMLDGDRIAILVAIYLNEKLAAAGLKLNLGMVQTAYANGGSTLYAAELGIPVACAKTGVKNLHHVALDYDVGVYFEANGHGTVRAAS